MADVASDDAFLRQLRQLGGATLEQIETAQRVQAAQAKDGVLLSLADVLIQQGVITPAIRENVEARARASQQGGIKQVGKYKLLKKLGEGGMGAVYLAEDLVIQRKVALKILPRKHADNIGFLTRFQREAKTTGKLNHVNIVTAYDRGEEQGLHFYAMEFCEGEPLDARLKRDKVLQWDQALGITIQIARGLKYAHDHGFIHRDIKPANIFITKDGTAKILDLGLSKDVSGSEQSFNTDYRCGAGPAALYFAGTGAPARRRSTDARTSTH